MTYKPHDKTSVPLPDTIIWRYLDLARFMSMLEFGALYFSSIAVLAKDDQWEAVFHRQLRQTWQVHTRVDNLDRSHQYLQERAFVSCWHMNDHESDAMWKLYSHGGNNLVIRSTFSKLCETLNSCAEPISVGEVEYVDHACYDYGKLIDSTNSSTILNITPVLLLKRHSYRHERELRAFYYTESPARGPETPGIQMFVDLKMLLDDIRVSRRSKPWFRDLIERLMAKYGLENVPVRRSDMDDDPKP